MKKILSLIIALVLTASAFAVLPVSAEDNVYNVSTAAELNEAITEINAMTASSSVVINLEADIVYNEGWTSEELYAYATKGTVPLTKTEAPELFTPLGSSVNSSNAQTSFMGTFNGNGHTISGLCVRRVRTSLDQQKEAQGAALIAFGKGATVNNVTIDRSAFFANEGCVGAIIGNSHGSPAVNNISNVSVTDIKAKSPNMYVGGIVGANYTALNVTNVYVEGHVESTFDPSDSKVYVGGVCGLNSGTNANLILKNAVVEADVSAKGFVGSFLGAGVSNGKTSITNAFASGDVTATSQKAGGIVGCVNSAGATTLKNCAYVGTATSGNSEKGPIFGFNNNTSVTATACYGFKKDSAAAATANLYGGCGSGDAVTVANSDVACKTRDELAAIIDGWGKAATDTFTNSTVALGALFNNTVVGIQTGYDKAAGEEGRTRAVRFVATIDATDYQEVGFIIKMTRPNGNGGTESVTVTKGTTSVYTSINSVADPTPASEFGSKYLIAIGVNQLDGVSELTFEVTSYVTTLDGNTYITDVKTVEYDILKYIVFAELNIPDYSNGYVVSAEYVGQNNRMVCIEDTTKDAYLSYKTQLLSNGYTLYTENEINGNLFATYTSKNTMLHTYYVAYNNTVRLVSAPMNSTNLPDVVKPNIVKTHTSSITQMILNYYDKTGSTNKGNYGNCYVIVLDDGSLMIYDGGGKHGSDTGDIDRLWSLIQELGMKGSDGKIKIAAWFITHEHQDHIWCTYNVLKNYASEIDLETIYCNTVHEKARSYTDASWTFVEGNDMKTLQTAYGNNIKVVRVHTGQKFWVRNAQIEILFTPEDIYPHNINDYTDFNDSSVISRITIDGTTFMMLGDTGKIGSEMLCSMYGTVLKSDVCQVAHHGYSYATEKLYEYIDPDLYMLPTSEGIFKGILNGTSSTITQYGETVMIVMDLIVRQVGEDGVLRADHNNKTFVFSTKQVIVRNTNNTQPGYPYGDKNTNGYK